MNISCINDHIYEPFRLPETDLANNTNNFNPGFFLQSALFYKYNKNVCNSTLTGPKITD